MYLYGASGHAKVIIEILEQQNKKIDCIFDDNEAIHSLFQYPVKPYTDDKTAERDSLIISIGNNRIRKEIAQKIGVNFGQALHPFTSLSARCVIGEGTVIMAGVVVNADTRIGRHCIINTNASVDHDCVVEDYVHLSPNAALCGNVTVGEGTHVGAGAVVIPGVTIGKWCHIGAGAVVIRDVPDFTTAVGNPSKNIKTNRLI